MKFEHTWLSLGTFMVGASLQRRHHYVFTDYSPNGKIETQRDPGWSFTLWLGIVNLTWETSDARSWVSERSGDGDSN
jgi:hypothetical protein